MFKGFTKLLLFCLLCPTVYAESKDLEIKLLNEKKKELNVGENFNVILMLTNLGNIDKEIQIRLIGAEDNNIKLIMNYSTILVAKRTSINKIISIQIPSDLKSGDFTIDLEALESNSKVSFGTIKIPVAIKPKYDLGISLQKSPPFLLAGDTANLYYVIQNFSNIDIIVNTKTIDGNLSKTSTLPLKKDSSIRISYLIKTSKSLEIYTEQSIILSASIKDMPETEKSIYATFEVFPLNTKRFDQFERLPIKVSGVAVTSNRTGKPLLVSMFDIQGSGEFGKERGNALSFHLRGPNRQGNPLLGLNDEYYLKYKSPQVEVAIGDVNFGLSELTESSRNGRGLQLQYNLKKWSIGSFFNKPRYYPLIKQIFAASTKYTFDENNVLSAGFLSKTDKTNLKANLVTLSSVNKPFSWLRSDVEVSIGQYQSKISKAFRASINLQRSIFSSYINYLFSDSNFPGYLTNSMRLFSGVSLNLKKFSCGLNYDINSTNQALDTLYSNLPISKNISLTTNYRLTPSNTVSLSANNITLRDRSPIPLFDYTKTTGRLAIQNRIKAFNLTILGEIGKMVNYLDNNDVKGSLTYNGNISLNYNLNNNISASGFASYQGGKQFVSGNGPLYYGGTLLTKIKNQFSIALQYTSNYEWQFYTSDRSLFSMNIDGQINASNSISITADYNLIKNTLNNREYNVQLRFSHLLNVPISKKKDIGSVTGKITNHGIDKIDGIRLTLNGINCVTDKDGKFKFPAVPIGTYILGVDFSGFGLNAISEVSGPMMITVAPGKVTNFDFAITRSAQIIGRLVVQEDERASQKGYIPVKERIDKLIIEATNGTDVYRLYTDVNGGFLFNDLKPGAWQVKVYPNGLPQGFELQTNLFNLNLLSGSKEKLDIVIKKKARIIRFQTSNNTKK